MTRNPQPGRACTRCGARLNRYNTGTVCGSCESGVLEPPDLPRAFWETERMREALATWHMGRVIYAYRTHPHHGRPLGQETVAGWLGLTQGQLSKLESGRAPEQLSKLIRWAQTLRIPGDLLWFSLPPHDTDTLDQVNRQDFLRAAASIAVAPAAMTDLIGALEPTPVPSMVGAHEIAQLREAASMFHFWDHAYGGGVVRDAVAAQLRYAVRLLEARCADRHRGELFSAVGVLSHTAAFMAFDAYAHTDARTMFRLALSCAEEVDDWQLRAKILSSMARQSIWCGNPDAGLTFAELALVRADRITPTQRAMLHTTRARALAKMGRVQDTMAAVGSADDEFDHASPSNDPAWMAYYDHAQHAGDTGHALFDLAIAGRFIHEARTRLAIAVDGHTDRYVRSRAISATKLATLVMTVGDPVEAAHIGQRALTEAGHLRSRRATDDLRDLQRIATQRADQPEVAELSTRIDELLNP